MYKVLLHLYFATICFTYVDCIFLIAVFKNVSFYCILNGATSFNPSPKKITPKLPISCSIFVKIATNSNLIPKANTNAAFCLAFAKCLYIGEISYTDKQQSEPLFATTKATHLDIQISPFGDYFIFHFK